ncbi:MAG: hypothetical protein HC869_07305 [Rhodospirillales bacterium]|nr:hypothetical protein [Rhodospirillales bacterium]
MTGRRKPSEEQLRNVETRIDQIKRSIAEQKALLANLEARGEGQSQAALILQALEADLASAEAGWRWLEGHCVPIS